MKQCNQCGKCCIKYSHGGLSATEEEIQLWDSFNPDIYNYVHQGKIWLDPDSEVQLERCPWLQQHPDKPIFTCAIYFDRPDDCRYYPVSIEQMIHDECEMLEKRDLLKPKQAQKQLDKMMADSRPPYR